MQFYAQQKDEDRCAQSKGLVKPITITGLNLNGRIQIFTGVVLDVKDGDMTHPDYPLKVTIRAETN